MHNQLAEIFKRAQEFYRLLYSQQSQLKLVMPKAIVNGEPYPFMPESMEEVNGVLDDETELRGTPIEITVFPAVCKTPASSDATVSIAPSVMSAMSTDTNDRNIGRRDDSCG